MQWYWTYVPSRLWRGCVGRSEAYGAMLKGRHRGDGPISLTTALEPENPKGGWALGDRGQPPTIVDDRAAHNSLPPSVRHEQPSYARPKVGERQHKHRQEIEVHGKLIRLLELFRRREGVASVRHRIGSIPRSSIRMPHIRPRKGRGDAGHLGCGRW